MEAQCVFCGLIVEVKPGDAFAWIVTEDVSQFAHSLCWRLAIEDNQRRGIVVKTRPADAVHVGTALTSSPAGGKRG